MHLRFLGVSCLLLLRLVAYIAVGPDGAVYVADSGGKRVHKFVLKQP
jgi:hypothetical protein